MFDDLSVPEAAYFFGLLQTDGSHSGDPDHKGAVTIELTVRDKDVLESIQSIVPMRTTIALRRRVTNFGPNDSATLRFHDQATRRSLAAAGLPPGPKSTNIGPPTGPISAPDYVRGLLDGDGSVGFTQLEYPFISFTTASPAMAAFIIDTIWQVCRKRRTVRPNARDGVYNIMVANHAASDLAQWAWYSDDVLGIGRKRLSARAVAAWVPDPLIARRFGRPRHAWTTEQDLIVEVHSVRDAATILGRSESSVANRRWRLRWKVR